jgi:hypothetical protein
MKWLAARAYEEIQRILTDSSLVADLSLVNILIGDETFPAVAGIDGVDLLAQLNAVVISANGNDALTLNDIVHHHQAFNLQVVLYRQTAAGENPVVETNDAVSRLLQEIVENYQAITVDGGSLFSIEPAGDIRGYDRDESLWFDDAGLAIAVGRFDLALKAEADT